eukprot:CAMPEP_0204237414 /NCGR_PEP_ID=MMETSP0361-20130328/93239_1 /ASSEMBLY_ACC=CAM_ASM_000343 /TAXON_ID=268821 /ORGANISM="Scrippsiella Hangoei, Strain SHTV-5" /LENGTH=40 /DNA_ID= /DNA_START= /DNA_END= /DNA_ORIENTATION=
MILRIFASRTDRSAEHVRFSTVMAADAAKDSAPKFAFEPG